MNILKYSALFALWLIPFVGFSQDEAYTIQGKVKPAYNGKFVKLIYTPEKGKKVTDSVQVANGRFTFKGILDRPLAAKLSLGGEEQGDRIDLFISAGTIRVVANDSLRYAQVSGTKLAEAHERLAKMGLRQLEYDIIHEVDIFRSISGDEQKKAYTPKLLSAIEKYNSNKRKVINRFITENPDSYVSLYYLSHNVSDALLNYEALFPQYDKLSQAVKDTPLGKEFAKRLVAAKGVLAGTMFKDFTSTTPEGKSLSLKEVVDGNTYTLVDFWASWCGPCRKENPHVVKTYEAFKGKGFTVLSVSLDDNAEKWKEAIKSDGMPWLHVSSLKGWKEPAAALYSVRAIPMNFLVDSKGKIVATNLRGDVLYEKVQGLLK